MAAGSAFADVREMDHIEPKVSRAHFSSFLEHLAMDDDQRLIAEMVYSDYAAELEDLATEIGQRAALAGRDRVQDALAGKIYVEPRELRRLRAAVLNAYCESWSDADRLVEDLVLNTRALLSDASLSSYDQALRELRRAIYLHPRREAEQDESYAGDGVDVISLFLQAQAVGGEFESLDQERVSQILADYELLIDSVLIETAVANRQGETDRAVARIERDKAARRKHEREAMIRWKRLHQVNQQAVNRIGKEAARFIGSEAQSKWLERFDHACFPWLYGEAAPRKQFDWILRHRLNDDKKRQAAEIYEDYRRQYDVLCREATALMLRGRMSFSTVLTSRMDMTDLQDVSARELYQDLLKNSGRRAKLDAGASADLVTLLTERQRNQMRADIAAAAYGRRRQ